MKPSIFEDHSSVPISDGEELLAAQFLKLARRLGYGGPLGMQALRWAQRQTPLHSRRARGWGCWGCWGWGTKFWGGWGWGKI